MMTQLMITHEDLEAVLLGKLQLLNAVADDQDVGISSDAKTIMSLLVDRLIKKGRETDTEQPLVTKELTEALEEFLNRDPKEIAKSLSKYVLNLHEKLSEANARVSVNEASIKNQISTSRKLEALSSPAQSSANSSSGSRKKRPNIKIEVQTDDGVDFHRWGGYGRRPDILRDILGENCDNKAAVTSLREKVENTGFTSGVLPSGAKYTLSLAE